MAHDWITMPVTRGVRGKLQCENHDHATTSPPSKSTSASELSWISNQHVIQKEKAWKMAIHWPQQSREEHYPMFRGNRLLHRVFTSFRRREIYKVWRYYNIGGNNLGRDLEDFLNYWTINGEAKSRRRKLMNKIPKQSHGWLQPC